MRYSIFCDESGHLLDLQQKVMVLGALQAPKERVASISAKLKQIKRDHGLNEHWELKWTKISNSKIDYYKSIIDYFMDEKDLHFRCVVVPDKNILDHERFDRSHDDFYYVMFYYALREMIYNRNSYDVFFDYKDAFQSEKLYVLKKYLQDQCVINVDSLRLHTIQSYESQLIQLTDLLIGVIGYANKEIKSSAAKTELVDYTQSQVKVSLVRSSALFNKKFNVFVWSPR
ncbi:MAG TPA: DUF3800 domain-containing protein [Candidatus Syntrophosphaera sp.]|nr:DUF3800 domain-containing protein [Candidatus Cloacimonadota bacterium]HOR03115.1 DUF3800 domain-containing protein [Candidatus Syntrophosphaera sp.]HOG31553.1 DUF3800 domain-containing protein [Candidatus Cloacimonadota bacterium]HPK82946.1 DUF3800 domain-containing protein [Candidatus Syntrophosphaera sp.]HQK29412.1 DUF3800 domain-containing protein [Candidatus Syntrophosphaera sp.]